VNWEADESVVVQNSQPRKAGNRLEGKTGRIRFEVTVRHGVWEDNKLAKGGRSSRNASKGAGRTVQVKITETGMSMGTVEMGMTSLLFLSTARSRVHQRCQVYCQRLEKPANWWNKLTTERA